MIELARLMTDPELFGSHFGGESWWPWRTLWKAAGASPLTSRELELYRKITSRETTPGELRELYLIVGRRAGKSINASLKAIELACFRDYSAHLKPGELATVMVLAADRLQARVCFNYVSGFLNSVPVLRQMVTKETAERIELSNQVAIEVHTSSFRSVRGYSLAGVICDEAAFWRSEESSNPDEEILAALRPGLASIPGSLLIVLSSPYRRRGVIWKAFKDHFGKERPSVLVVQAPSLVMNPSLDEGVVSSALEADPAMARSEWLAEFRSDLEGYVSLRALENCIVPDRLELPHVEGIKYRAFVDPSGGGRDSYTLAIAHLEAGTAILDRIREYRPPFSPEGVTAELSELLKQYRIKKVQGDRYAGQWPSEQFEKRQVEYKPAGSTKSDLYRDLLPLLNSGRVELLDNPRLKNQFLNLERRTSRGGRDSIDHPPKGHDDIANAAAGALLAVSRLKPRADYSKLELGHGACASKWKPDQSRAGQGRVTLMA